MVTGPNVPPPRVDAWPACFCKTHAHYCCFIVIIINRRASVLNFLGQYFISGSCPGINFVLDLSLI